MRKSNFFFWAKYLCFAMVLFACASCKNDAPKNKFTIGFSQCTGLDLWRRVMLDEMKAELSMRPDLNFVYADAHGNSKRQVGQIEKMLQDGVDLLIISPNEAEPLTAIVNSAYQKNVPVIIIDRKTNSTSYTAYIGTDNVQLGKAAAQYLSALSARELNVLEITGLSGSSPAIDRAQGFLEGASRSKNIHIQKKIAGDWLESTAKNNVYKLKGELSGINAVFAHNDDMALGAKKVFDNIYPGKAIKIIGVDGLPGLGGGMEMVDNKQITASLVYPTLGKEAVVTAIKILNKEPFLRENILQSLVVDSTNVQMMKMQWSKIKSQQSDIAKQQDLLAEQQAIYQDQQTVLNVTVISLVLAMIFGGLAFYSSMENRKTNRHLEATNIEVQLQKNQLVEMSAKASAATEARFNFFTNVTHEFRTPLTLMFAPLNDLLTKRSLAEPVTHDLKLINQNAYRLLTLVNQLIDYRKIEVDKQSVKASENNIIDFAREIVECFRLHAKNLQIQLHYIPGEREIPVWFDVNLMDKVFFNLLSNAIKFVSQNGVVKLYVRRDAHKVYIEVQDNGSGMSQEEAALIFDNFYQADNSPRMGSGIGLSLSKEIVDLHHGEILVKTKKWEGSCFTIVLPLGNAHFAEHEKAGNHNEWPDMRAQSALYQASLEGHSLAAMPALDVAPKDITILIVEDNKDLLNYLVARFSEHYEVVFADNGNDALVQAYEKVPDLIIADIVIPGISGKEIAQTLKTDVKTSHIPIILLTAQTSSEQQISGLNSLADMYILKPFNLDYVMASAENLLRNRKLLKEHFTSDISSGEKLNIPKTLDKKFLNDFAGIVEKNLANENFNVEDLCKLIGVSRIQLYRKVKALLGCTVNDYILGRRLKKASYLLKNENLTIAEVTYAVGFSSPNYFSTAFKAKYGCSPTEFKTSVK